MTETTLEKVHIEYYKNNEISKSKDPRYKWWFELKENASYKSMIEMAAFRDLNSTRFPEKNKDPRKWKRNISILELGFGIQCYGIINLVKKYHINPLGIFGIEASDVAIRNANIIANGGTFIKCDYSQESLIAVLDALIEKGIQFNVIMSRYFMEGFANQEEIIGRIKLLLKPINTNNLKIRGVYVQTSKGFGSEDEFIVNNRQTIATHVDERRVTFNDGSWPNLMNGQGLEVYEVTRNFSETYTNGYEITIFSRRVM